MAANLTSKAMTIEITKVVRVYTFLGISGSGSKPRTEIQIQRTTDVRPSRVIRGDTNPDALLAISRAVADDVNQLKFRSEKSPNHKISVVPLISDDMVGWTAYYSRLVPHPDQWTAEEILKREG